jgi:protein SCO1
MFGHAENNPCFLPHYVRMTGPHRWPGRPRQPAEKGARMIVRPVRYRSRRKDTAVGLSQGPGTAPRAPAAASARRRGRLAMLAALALAVAAAAGTSGYVIGGHPGTAGVELRASGIPASISDSIASLMNLDTLPHKAAPGFAFTDQAGRTMTLSDFRGKVVVLEFLDPHCTDICPIVSREFLDAYHDLGTLAGRVVFAGINVNPYHTRGQDVLAFSREQQLTTIPDWHYFTGPVPRLRPVWDAYHIYVQAPNPSADVVHTSAAYFIDPQGRERYLASPQVDHAQSGASYLPADQISAWGRAIAALARSLAQLSPGRLCRQDAVGLRGGRETVRERVARRWHRRLRMLRSLAGQG